VFKINDVAQPSQSKASQKPVKKVSTFGSGLFLFLICRKASRNRHAILPYYAMAFDVPR